MSWIEKVEKTQPQVLDHGWRVLVGTGSDDEGDDDVVVWWEREVPGSEEPEIANVKFLGSGIELVELLTLALRPNYGEDEAIVEVASNWSDEKFKDVFGWERNNWVDEEDAE